MRTVVQIGLRFDFGNLRFTMHSSCWMLFTALFIISIHRSLSQVNIMDLIPSQQGLYHDSGWPPGQDLNYFKLARDMKTQFFSALIGDKQQAEGGGGGSGGNKRRDRITALFIKLMTRLFRHRPFQRLICGSNATCLAGLNTPSY